MVSVLLCDRRTVLIEHNQVTGGPAAKLRSFRAAQVQFAQDAFYLWGARRVRGHAAIGELLPDEFEVVQALRPTSE